MVSEMVEDGDISEPPAIKIVVNAAAKVRRPSSAGVPILRELTALSGAMRSMYASTLEPRVAKQKSEMGQAIAGGAKGPHSVLINFDLAADTFLSSVIDGPSSAHMTERAYALKSDLAYLEELKKLGSDVHDEPTRLSRLAPNDAQIIVRLGYEHAALVLHVVEGWKHLRAPFSFTESRTPARNNSDRRMRSRLKLWLTSLRFGGKRRR
jgi:hypothetical protein